MTDRGLLRIAAERAARRPFFLASVLLPYARAERLDDAGLAAALGCRAEDLPALLLCRRPGHEVAEFRMDVQRIADRFGIVPAHLAHIVRLAEAVHAFGSAQSETGLLAAARDRDDLEREGGQTEPGDTQPRDPGPEDDGA